MGDRRESLDDLELLAALIDGRLQGGEREKALAKVAADPALYEIFVQAQETAVDADARTVSGERAIVAEARVVPLWRRARVPLAVAATLLVVAFGLQLAGFFGSGALPSGTAGIAAEISAAGGLPADWASHDWVILRGGGAAAGEARASARAGVQILDLAVAWRRGEDERVTALAAELARTIAGLPLGSAVAARLEPFLPPLGVVCDPDPCGDAPRTAAPAFADLDAAVTAAAEPAALELGRWVEAVRLAARSGDLRSTARWLATPPVDWRRAFASLGIEPEDAVTPLGTSVDALAVAGPTVGDLDTVASAASDLIARF